MQTTHQNEFLNQILKTQVLLGWKPLCVDIYLNCLQTHWILQPGFSFLGEVFHSCTHNPEHKIRSVFLSFATVHTVTAGLHNKSYCPKTTFPLFSFPLPLVWLMKQKEKFKPKISVKNLRKKPSSSNACLAITETCPLFLLFTNIKSIKSSLILPLPTETLFIQRLPVLLLGKLWRYMMASSGKYISTCLLISLI